MKRPCSLAGQSVNWKIQLSDSISGLLMPLFNLLAAWVTVVVPTDEEPISAAAANARVAPLGTHYESELHPP